MLTFESYITERFVSPGIVKSLVKICYDSCELTKEDFKESDAVIKHLRKGTQIQPHLLFKPVSKLWHETIEFDSIQIDFNKPVEAKYISFVFTIREEQSNLTDSIRISVYWFVQASGMRATGDEVFLDSYTNFENNLRAKISRKLRSKYDGIKFK